MMKTPNEIHHSTFPTKLHNIHPNLSHFFMFQNSEQLVIKKQIRPPTPTNRSPTNQKHTVMNLLRIKRPYELPEEQGQRSHSPTPLHLPATEIKTTATFERTVSLFPLQEREIREGKMWKTKTMCVNVLV